MNKNIIRYVIICNIQGLRKRVFFKCWDNLSSKSKS